MASAFCLVVYLAQQPHFSICLDNALEPRDE